LERLFEAMDKARIDKPRILRESFHPLSYKGVPCPIAYHTIKAMEKYPDHIVGCSNGGFHLIRGVSDATEELKILNLVRQLNSEVCQES